MRDARGAGGENVIPICARGDHACGVVVMSVKRALAMVMMQGDARGDALPSMKNEAMQQEEQQQGITIVDVAT